MSAGIRYDDSKELPQDAVLELYESVDWSSASKPDALMAGLRGSHSVVTAWNDSRLIGLGNAISDGFHQQVVLSDRDAVGFYERCGLERAGSTIALWTYDDEHS